MDNQTDEQRQIKLAIQSGIPITITTYTLPHETEVYMNHILELFLKELNQENMIHYLTYCLSELVGNAKKANTKRIYFHEKNLDINNKNDYKVGMTTFKSDTLNNIKYYLGKQEEEGLFIKFILLKENNTIKIEVKNNVELTYFEYVRIHDKMSRAQQYTSVDQALKQLLDDSEGAGLGLVIMILMLKKIGLTEENYRVISENGETITRMTLPISSENVKFQNLLSYEFVNYIEELPQFPENITAINRLLDDPLSKMSDIAEKISNDVTLTADLLRLVNSASFGRSIRCHSIGDAVKLVGIRGIKNMMFSIGTIKSLTSSSDESDKKELWTHAYKAAFFSYNLAVNLCPKDRNCIEDSYVCGLLHDIGKIAFDSAHPDTLNLLKQKLLGKGVSEMTFEKLIAGVDHGEIGAMITEKWNFPEIIANALRYHHSPLNAPQKMQKLISLIYIADMMIHYIDGEIRFDQINPDVLKIFNLTEERVFNRISEMMKVSFAKK